MFTWLFGWTFEYSPGFPPSFNIATFAITSFIFILKGVPAPAWNTSRMNWSLYFPSMISSAAWIITSPMVSFSMSSLILAFAHAFLMMASDFIKSGSALMPLILKFLEARVVKAPYKTLSGTSISPRLSNSFRLILTPVALYNIYSFNIFLDGLACVKSINHPHNSLAFNTI